MIPPLLREARGPDPMDARDRSTLQADIRLGDLLRILRRRRWLIVGVAFGAVALATVYVFLATPVYQASASIRIEVKQPETPAYFKTLSSGSAVLSESQVLHSRTLVEDAVGELGLQLEVTQPRGVARGLLLADVHVERTAGSASYQLRQLADGRFTLLNGESGAALDTLRPGARATLFGVTFVLAPQALLYQEIDLAVRPFNQVVSAVMGSVDVSQPVKDGNVLVVSYEAADRDLVWRVPNVIVDRFMGWRRQVQKTEARSLVGFLRVQLDTLAYQLAAGEDRLRGFREREQVIDPDVEVSSQVTRLVSLQADRATAEAERQALATFLREVQDSAAHLSPGAASPYRRLIAFPSLLRNPTVAEQVRSLASLDDERANLLTRRKPQDPDVQVLDARIADLEGQVRTFAETYLQGLTRQVASLDSALLGFQGEVSRLPGKQLTFARLERGPRILESLYVTLQTRLREAEIAEAVEDPSVQIVDRAIAPLTAVWPRPMLTLAVAVVLGVLLGLMAALVWDFADTTVHSRLDAQVATGLPVLGIIPRIAGRRGRPLALTIENRRLAPAKAGAVSRESDAQSGSGAGETELRAREKDVVMVSYRWLGAAASPTEAEPALLALDAEPIGGTSEGQSPAREEARARVLLSPARYSVAEAYGTLQTNLRFALPADRLGVLMITSPLPGDGKSTSAINLAITMAESGLRTLLIDADLRHSVLHTVFDTHRNPGLSDLLRGVTSVPEAVRRVRIGEQDGSSLHYLTAGTMVSAPTRLIGSKRLEDLLQHFRSTYDRVILDAPPVNIVSDAAILAPVVDGVILVARVGSTHTAALTYAAEQLAHVRAPLLGVALNDVDLREEVAYDSVYEYYTYEKYLAQPTQVSHEKDVGTGGGERVELGSPGNRDASPA